MQVDDCILQDEKFQSVTKLAFWAVVDDCKTDIGSTFLVPHFLLCFLLVVALGIGWFEWG
jgi:hypothetical protein